MSRRSSRTIIRTRFLNLGLIAGLGILGCGEARQSQQDIEPPPNGTVGNLKVLIANYGDHSETLYRLIKDDGEDIGLNFGTDAPRPRVGERIAVRGQREGDRITVIGYDIVQRRIGDTQQAILTGAPDPQDFRVAAISLTTATSKATLTKRVFQDPDSPTAFYRENSYGTWKFTGESYGPYTLTTTSCADSNLYVIASEAAALAKGDGFDPANYENVMYFVPSSLGCSWGGVAEVGTNPARTFWNAKHSWYAGTGCVVLAQELGHNYGLLHSHKCTGGPYANGANLRRLVLPRLLRVRRPIHADGRWLRTLQLTRNGSDEVHQRLQHARGDEQRNIRNRTYRAEMCGAAGHSGADQHDGEQGPAIHLRRIPAGQRHGWFRQRVAQGLAFLRLGRVRRRQDQHPGGQQGPGLRGRPLFDPCTDHGGEWLFRGAGEQSDVHADRDGSDGDGHGRRARRNRCRAVPRRRHAARDTDVRRRD